MKKDPILVSASQMQVGDKFRVWDASSILYGFNGTVMGISVPTSGSAYAKMTFRENNMTYPFIPGAENDEPVFEKLSSLVDPDLLDDQYQESAKRLAEAAKVRAAVNADYYAQWRAHMDLGERLAEATVQGWDRTRV